jgi:hypothetical protein
MTENTVVIYVSGAPAECAPQKVYFYSHRYIRPTASASMSIYMFACHVCVIVIYVTFRQHNRMARGVDFGEAVRLGAGPYLKEGACPVVIAHNEAGII